MSQEIPSEEIEVWIRPFFNGIENEFSHIYSEVEGLKDMIEFSVASMDFSKTEQWMFDAARASSIEKIYSGIERILIRIGIRIDGYFPPNSGAGNREALDRLSVEMPVSDWVDIRPAVISEETLKILHDLRRFRRQERGTYGCQIDSLNIAENAEKAIAIVPVVKAEVDQFKINLATLEYFKCNK
jgi:hypothetical protein